MEEYVWVSKLADHSVFTGSAHPVLNRLAAEYDVRVTIAGPKDTSLDDYLRAIYDAIERRVAGIMVIGWGDQEVIPAIDAAIEQGIPVVTVDSDVPNSKRLAHIGTDWFRMGGAMADDLATRIGGRGKVLMIGMTDLANSQTGFRGFQDRMAAYSNMELLGPENDLDVGYDRAQKIVEEYLKRYPDLVGVAGFDGNSGPGAAAAVDSAGKSGEIKIVCVDDESNQLEYLKSGTINSIFAQKRHAFTNLAFQMLYSYNHGSAATGYRPGAINIPGNIDTGYVLVTTKNIESFRAEFSHEEASRRHDLSQRLALVSSVVENSAEIALASDSEGRLVYANQSALKLFGLNESRLVESSIESLFNLDDRQKELLSECAVDGRTVRFEAIASLDNDSAVPYQVSVSPLYAGELVRGLVVIATDVSSLKQVKHALRESEEKYSHLFNNLSDAIFVHDLRGNIIDINKKALDIFGYSRSEIMDMNIAQMHPKEELENSQKAFEQISKKGFVNFEVRFLKKNGDIFLAEVSSTLLNIGDNRIVQGVVRDITDRKESEKLMSLLSSVVKQSTEGIAVVDLDGNLQFTNDAFADMHGYSADDLIGRHLSVFHTAEQLPSVDEANRQIIETGKFTGEIGHKRRDGSVFPSFMSNFLLRDANGNPTGIIGNMRDITRRKETEAALRDSEERYRTFVQNFQGIAFRGKLDFSPIFLHGAVEKVTGYTEAEFIAGNLHWDQIVHPQDFEKMSDIVKQINITPGYFTEQEYRIIRKSGEVGWVHMSIQNICDEFGKPSRVQGAIYDITGRKEADEALRESEERFRIFFQTNPDVMTVSDLSTGRIIDVNESFVETSGYSREEIIGASSKDLDMWSDPSVRSAIVDKLKKHGTVRNIETRFKIKNGELRTCLVTGNIILLREKSYMFTVVRDIEGLRQAQLALRESEERFRTIFEAAQDAIFIKDRDLKYLAVNPSLARLFGMTPEQFVGKTFEELVDLENAEYYRVGEQKVLNGEIISTETSLYAGDEQRILDVIIVPMQDARGEIIGLCGIARDITETKRLHEFAERAKRLEAAGRIAGQVAHDFNNLLGPLIAYPGLMREELADDHPAVEYLDDLEKAAEQMADINQQLLTLGRRGHYNLEPLDINETIRTVIERSQPYPEGIKVNTILEPEVMNISGGSAQLYRVIYNLVANALDALTAGGDITIKTENYYINSDLGRYNQVPRGEYVKVTISDTGSGIDDDIRPSIFDPFFTTKKADRKRGSGLGLSIVHAVVEDHKGFIDINSRPGQGTSFYLYFPITRDKAESVDTETFTGGNEKVMIVDDDPIQKEVTSRLLQRLGYKITVVGSGEEAIELLKQSPQDLLILDMVMSPGIDGAETYRRSLEVNRHQKAIIVSGFAETDKVKAAIELGAAEFLRKPLTMKSLANAVRKELD